MSKLTFTDGETFDLSGPLRLEERFDGWYVLGNNKMIPVGSQDEGNKLITQLKLKHMNVNELMNMNDMYYVGNLVDVDGNGWVSKAEAIEILNELGMGDDDNNNPDGYGDESPAEYKRMLATVGIKI